MDALQTLDLKHNWHPCSQMKDYERFKPLSIKRAYDCYIELSDGQKLIDATSSWWCKSLGHNHPDLKKALMDQIVQFEHVIFANTTYETIAKLSQSLASIMPGLDKVFYAGDGSCAVEIALKMSVHSRVIQGEPHKNRFIALKNGYHGETTGALSVSDVGIYRAPYSSLLFPCHFVEPLYVSGMEDALWHDASDHWGKIENELNQHAKTLSAIIVEPILQGAGGMQVYSQNFLLRISEWAARNNVHLIADEIMTGIGRTGKMLACEHAKIKPDFICLSKGLTSGWMPFSCVLTTNEIYQTFYDDYKTGKSFLHSHTYSGNALGASLALATLNLMQKHAYCDKALAMQASMRLHMEEIAKETGLLKNIRGIGALIAADLIVEDSRKRYGYQFYQEAVKHGALMRPLGNTIYWMPPFTISTQTLLQLKKITKEALISTFT